MIKMRDSRLSSKLMKRAYALILMRICYVRISLLLLRAAAAGCAQTLLEWHH